MNYHLIIPFMIILVVAAERPRYIIETEDGILHGFPEKLKPIEFKSVHLHPIPAKSKLECLYVIRDNGPKKIR